MSVLWLEGPRFEEAFSMAFPDQKTRWRHTLDERFQTQVSLKEIEALVSIPRDSRGDPSDPGPAERWYGVIQGAEPFFFVLTYYYGVDNACIATPPPNSRIGPYRWSPLRKLSELPRPLAQRVNWMRGHLNTATQSLVYRDAEGKTEEGYRAENSKELEALKTFLAEQEHEIDFFVSPAISYTLEWHLYRPEQKRGWYPLESHSDFRTCAARARELSRDGELYCVSEYPQDYFSVGTLAYRNGSVETF